MTMTIRQFYWYPVLWYLFATIVAFIAAILFWKRGSSTAEGRVPGLSVTWKFTGAAAIFVVVLLVFFVINPLKPFTDYKKIFIVYSAQPLTSSTEVGTPFKITQAQIAAQSISFDPNTLQVQMIPYNFIYELYPELDDNSFVTINAVPKGKYRIRLISSKTGESKEFVQEVK